MIVAALRRRVVDLVSRRGLQASLLVVAACSSSDTTAPMTVATSITLSATNISFSSLRATLDLTATVWSEGGTPVSSVSPTWSTQDARVATVSPGGRVTAVANGVTRVTASVAGAEASATVHVQQVPFAMTLSPDPVELEGPLETVPVIAAVLDAGGSPVVPAGVTWTALDESVATVDADGHVTGVATGRTTVTGEVGTGGAPLRDSVTVNVGGSVLVVTTSLPPGAVGSPYEETLAAVGGDHTYAWAVLSGSLPAGLDLAPDGTISGTPTVVGASAFTVEVTSGGETDAQDLVIDILSSVFLSESYLVGGSPGATYSDRIAPATGGDGSYTYALTAGGLPPGLSLAPSDGAIAGRPSRPGVYFFEITASSGGQASSALYAITVSTAPASDFNMWISFQGAVLPPANMVLAVEGALARWEEIVVGDVGNVVLPPSGLTPGTCSLIDPSILNGAVVDDVALVLTIGPFDGPGKTLARGGPCGYGRGSLPTSITGQIQLDEADVTTASVSYLEAIVWHEIAHAMGIGTFWSQSLTGSGTPMPRYAGTYGNSEWRALGTAFDGVPVQPSVEAHWDEAWLDSEIMTPNTEGPTGVSPISRVTIGALIDLGWTADLAAADFYTLPGCAEICSLRAPGEVVPFDVVVSEPLLPLPR